MHDQDLRSDGMINWNQRTGQDETGHRYVIVGAL